MGKALTPILVLALVGGLVWYLSQTPHPTAPATSHGASGHSAGGTVSSDGGTGGADSGAGSAGVGRQEGGSAEGEIELSDAEPVHATEAYKSAEEALEAIKKGAVTYDDLVLEQFTELGENCSWCDAFFQGIKSQLFAGNLDREQRGYYAEVLALSGRLENIKTLTEAITSAKNQEEADLFAEALEMTVASPDVVKHMSGQLASTDNETLRDSLVAALTNQRSRDAAEALFEHVRKGTDSSGYENVGMGPAEFVPDEEALPVFQEAMNRRDQYSNLAAKGLANAGLSGIRMVFDAIAGSNDEASNRELLRGLEDHVSYDEETSEYFKQIVANPKNKLLSEFAAKMAEEFQTEEAELQDGSPAEGQ